MNTRILRTASILAFVTCCMGLMPGQSGPLPDQCWTDLVTEQPEGYVVDGNGDVHLYSAEALAWLSVVSNGLNGQEADDFEGRTICLEANVDMSEALWTPISENNDTPAFRGTFDGKGHKIEGLQLTAANTAANRTGFFAKTTEAALLNVVIRNGYFDGYGYGIGFFTSLATKSTIKHCFVECEMHGGGELVPFVYASHGSEISNCLVYSPLLKATETGMVSGIFVATNAPDESHAPRIQNCASIIEKMDWTEHCGLVGLYNYGLIENSYAYIGEFIDFGGYGGGPAPRNGITENNLGAAEIVNCYYNRVRNHAGMPYYIEMDDQPASANEGVIHNAIPFSEEGQGLWKLTQSVGFGLESGTVSTDDLLEALNFKIQEMNDDGLLDWCETGMGFNHQRLPVFCDFDITETAENVANDHQIAIFPNPTQGELTIEGEGINTVRIVNVYGQTIHNAMVDGDQACIDLSGMTKGVYVMQIGTENGNVARKVVVE